MLADKVVNNIVSVIKFLKQCNWTATDMNNQDWFTDKGNFHSYGQNRNRPLSNQIGIMIFPSYKS